ncbi:MAG: hypothetical protein NTY77_14255 [Elusimicrobia bacterium]|nr:hypothetical protein [Elusimicrobiota bacterium]
MRTMLCSALVALLGAPALAGGLEQAKTDLLTPALSEGLAAIKAASPRWTSVSMNVDSNDPFYDVRDMSLRINLNGSKSGNAYFSFNGNAGGQYLYLSASPYSSQDPRQGYTLSGSMVNLSINRSGSSYSINGWVNHKNIWLQATPYAGGGFSLWGQMGLNLNVSGMGRSLWVTGSVDLNEFDEPTLASLGAALCVLNSLPPQAK